MRIVIVGAGSVGSNLAHAFEIKGIRVELVHGRPITADPSPKVELPQADCYIYAIADHALEEVVAKIDAPQALHLHTSGSMPLSVFGEDKPHAGVMYFFQSFSREILIDDWSGIPCFIEGRNIDDIAAIYSLAQNLSDRIYECNQHDRERLHVAGVFANNFTNLMYRIAAEILKDTQIPFEALLPLIDQTAAKIHTISPKDAQTGPAKRGDAKVMLKHLEVLNGINEDQFFAIDLQFIYTNLGQLIQTAGIPPEKRVPIMELLNRAISESDETSHGRQAQARRRGSYPKE
jgi:predicted short-subunit dehydrogenase-like oxidoreductase (DUF2520 family)